MGCVGESCEAVFPVRKAVKQCSPPNHFEDCPGHKGHMGMPRPSSSSTIAVALELSIRTLQLNLLKP